MTYRRLDAERAVRERTRGAVMSSSLLVPVVLFLLAACNDVSPSARRGEVRAVLDPHGALVLARDPVRELALVGHGGGVSVYRLSDWSRPLGTATLSHSLPNAVAWVGDHAWFLHGRTTGEIVALTGIDLRDPAHPAMAGRITWPEQSAVASSDLTVVDGHLVVALARDVKVISIADPRAPVEIGSVGIETIQTFGVVARAAGGVWVNHHDGARLRLAAIDLTDPRSPRLGEATTIADDEELRRIPSSKLARAGDLLVVADSERITLIQDEANPKVRGSVAVPGAPARIWSHAYPIGDRIVAFDMSLTAEPARLHVVDIADPEAPAIIATLPAAAGCTSPGPRAMTDPSRRSLTLACSEGVVQLTLDDADRVALATLWAGAAPTVSVATTTHGILSVRGAEIVLRAARPPFDTIATVALPDDVTFARLRRHGDRVSLVTGAAGRFAVHPIGVDEARIEIRPAIASSPLPFVQQFAIHADRYLIVPASDPAPGIEIRGLDGTLVGRVESDRLVSAVTGGDGDLGVVETLEPLSNGRVEVYYQALDIRDPGHPALHPPIQMFDSYLQQDAVLVGTTFYVVQAPVATAGGALFSVIDFADPDRPRHRAGRLTSAEPNQFGYGLALRLVGRHALVADGLSGVSLFDVGHADLPLRAGRIDTIDFASAIDLDTDREILLVADRSSLQMIAWPASTADCAAGTYESLDQTCLPAIAPSCPDGECCLDAPTCHGGRRCVPEIGTCRLACSPFEEGSCGGGDACVLWFDDRFGCHPAGEVPIGASCTVDPNTRFDDCQAGALCIADDELAAPVCRRLCPLGAGASCGDPAAFECAALAPDIPAGVCMPRM